jgi:lipoyl(octanoyl) transferase
MHGFALNCNNDLSWFDRIVPCGIRDAGVTTLSKEIGRDISIEQVAGRAEFHLRRVFGQIAKDLSKDLVIDA